MIDKTGTWIETYTGKRVNAFNPEPDSICIIDISHALSLSCRFNGHVRKFISVGQHTLFVCELIKDLYRRHLVPTGSIFGDKLEDPIDLNNTIAGGLFHDFSEAYLNDIPKPFKQSMPEYKSIEANLSTHINKFLGLPKLNQSEEQLIKIADILSCLVEAALYVDSELKDWTYPDIFKDQWKDYAVRGASWEGWDYTPQKVEASIVGLYYTLKHAKDAF